MIYYEHPVFQYPDWSARDNYARRKKKQKPAIKSNEGGGSYFLEKALSTNNVWHCLKVVLIAFLKKGLTPPQTPEAGVFVPSFKNEFC